jgi:[ribosomal protein S5]-alanine N-acetyltransferase
MRSIASKGVALEPQTAAHAEEMFAILSDSAIYEFENEPPPSLDWLRSRFSKLETRLSRDGTEQWLNWVVRNSDSRLVGYVQATVNADGQAHIAYVLGSAHWGKGIARRAVEAMIDELIDYYDVRTLWAIFKESNVRSRRLLERLAFSEAPREWRAQHSVEPDESIMVRRVDRA